MDKSSKKAERHNQPYKEDSELLDEKGFIVHGKKNINTRHNSNLEEDKDDKKHLETHFSTRVNYSGPDQVIDDDEDDFNTASSWNSDWQQ